MQTLGDSLDRSLLDIKMPGVTLPSGLLPLSFGHLFLCQRLQGVALVSSVQRLTFGDVFSQSLQGVTLPSGVQT